MNSKMAKAFRRSVELIRSSEYQLLANKIAITLFHSWVHKDRRTDAWMRNVHAWQEKAVEAISDKCIIIYTCVTNGYDIPRPIPGDLQGPQRQFILFTDDDSMTAEGWTRRLIPASLSQLTPAQINRYIKLHPFELLDSDYSVYIDGNLELTVAPDNLLCYAALSPLGFASFSHGLRDCVYEEAKACIILGKGYPAGIDRQIEYASALGIKPHSGLIEACVLVSDLRNDYCRQLYHEWWNVFNECGSGRDQLAFPCALVKCGYAIEDVGLIGHNIRGDARFIRHEHASD